MNALAPPPAPQFPPNPTVGEVFLNWVWNGSAWICRGAGPVNIIKAISVSGTYWPSPGLTFAVVECIGGGGGGGGAHDPDGSHAAGGGGGGSGGYSRKSVSAALVVNGVQVTIGAGGLGGYLGTQPGTGGAGGATSFGALCVANGGSGGIINDFGVSFPSWGMGGPGATAGVGDVALTGNGGTSGDAFATSIPSDTPIIGGQGAAIIGGKAVSVWVISSGWSPGWNATSAGAGGGGGVVNQLTGSGDAMGGVGGGGLCIVTEWCFGNTSLVQDCGCGPGVGDPCQPQPCPPGGQGWWTPSW